MRIHDVHCRMILDSRGEPTIEVQMQGDHGSVVASVPSGKSRGAHEATPIHPTQAVEHCATIAPLIKERVFVDQQEFDGFLIRYDGTNQKSNLGANLILGLSWAFARLTAHHNKIPLWQYLHTAYQQYDSNAQPKIPYFLFNVINGGAHVDPPEDWIVRNGHPQLGIQEFQIIPFVTDPAMALSMGKEFYDKLGRALRDQYGKNDVFLGDEAGYVAPFANNDAALEILDEHIRQYRYPIRIGLDVAASQLMEHGAYSVDGKSLSPAHMARYIEQLINRYDIISVEDPFNEEDFTKFAQITHATRQTSTMIITDDLTTTNPHRLERALSCGAGNAILIKPNQIGTITETLQVVAMAHKHGWRSVVSHRSGETMDDGIADLAVGVGAWGLKSGAPGAPERMAKYERVVAIMTAMR